LPPRSLPLWFSNGYVPPTSLIMRCSTSDAYDIRPTVGVRESALEGGGAADLDELPAGVAPSGGVQLQSAVDDHLGPDQGAEALRV
jgi:hypothetical protein